MPEYKAGDHVLIVSGGYQGEGIQNGDVALVVSGEEGSGCYVTGLPGTWAYNQYPNGLYFLQNEVKLYERKSKQEDKPMLTLEVGKYYRIKSGKVYGPMVAYDDNYLQCEMYGDKFYIQGGDSANPWKKGLTEEFNLGPQESVTELKAGMLMLRGKRLIRICSLGRDGSLVNYSYNGSWDQTRPSTLIAEAVNLPDHFIDLSHYDPYKDKWVKYGSEWVQYKMSGLNSEDNILSGSVRHWFYFLGAGYLNSTEASGLDFTTAQDQHPKEISAVKYVQGEGEFLYAVKRDTGALNFAYYNGYTFDGKKEVYFFDTEDFCPVSYYLDPKGKVFLEYNVHASDTAPGEYPFDAKAYQEMMEGLRVNGTNDLVQWLRDNVSTKVATRAIMYNARMASNTRGNIALYQNAAQQQSGKIQSMRPGRAIKFLMPDITDKELEKVVDKFRKDFPAGDYTVKRGFEAADFKRAYGHTSAPMQNPRTTMERKSLGNSCMRHDFTPLPYHPAEAYASGEFEMIWSETPEGRIASRLVVWHPPEGHKLHGTPQGGPVYGVCEYSLTLLEDLLVSMGGKKYDGASWSGARMQKLEHSGGVIAPYLDHEQSLEDKGDWLKVGGRSDYDACTYDGVLGANDDYISCDECGRNIHTEYDSYHHTDGHGCICESCHNNLYFYCEYYEEDYPREEMCTVSVKTRWGRERQYVCEDARDNYYTLCTDGEYWGSDDVVYLANGEYLSPMDAHEATECEFNGDLYLVEDTLTTWDDRVMSKDYFNDNLDSYTLNADGVVVELQEEAA